VTDSPNAGTRISVVICPVQSRPAFFEVHQYAIEKIRSRFKPRTHRP
jgi:hypothetical protein